MANDNLLLTAEFAVFLPPLFYRKSCKSNNKFTAVNGKRQIHIYDEFTNFLDK